MRHRRRNFDWSLVGFAVIAAIAIISVLYTAHGWQDCTEAGGHYVRGVFLYECIQDGR